jgi:hypothetical protein
MQPLEEFKPFPNEKYENRYLVSSNGEILSKKYNIYIKKQQTNNHNTCVLDGLQ